MGKKNMAGKRLAYGHIWSKNLKMSYFLQMLVWNCFERLFKKTSYLNQFTFAKRSILKMLCEKYNLQSERTFETPGSAHTSVKLSLMHFGTIFSHRIGEESWPWTEDLKRWSLTIKTGRSIGGVLLHEKFLQFVWRSAVVFQLNLKLPTCEKYKPFG